MINCAIFIPYFQKFSPCQKLLAKTISWNPNFLFIFLNFSNQPLEHPFPLLNNTQEIKLTNSQFFEKIQSKLNVFPKNQNLFQIPKKYNDYSPTFGVIFHDILQNYPLWGLINPNLLAPNLNQILLNYDPHNAEIFTNKFPNSSFLIFRNITVTNYLFSRLYNIESILTNSSNYNSLSSLKSLIPSFFDIKSKTVNEYIYNPPHPFSFVLNPKSINNSNNFILDFSNTSISNNIANITTLSNLNSLTNTKFSIHNNKISKII